jgi:hypothetical protein
MADYMTIKPEFRALETITKAAELCIAASEIQVRAMHLCLQAKDVLARAVSIRTAQRPLEK